jgi:hypothetical protein
MPYAITCTSCSARLKTATKVPIGKSLQCPKCRETFPVSAGNMVEIPDGTASTSATAKPPAKQQAEAPKSAAKSRDHAPSAKGKSQDRRDDGEAAGRRRGQNDDDAPRSRRQVEGERPRRGRDDADADEAKPARRERDGTAKKPKSVASLPLIITNVLIVAAAVGLSQYAGLAILVPVVLALMIGLLLFFVVSKRNRPMISASAVQIGQFVLMVMPLIVDDKNIEAVSITDVLLLAALCISSVLLPFLPPMIMTVMVVLSLLYQGVGIANDILVMSDAPLAPAAQRVIVSLIVFHFCAIAALAVGLIEIRKADERAARLPEKEPIDDRSGLDDPDPRPRQRRVDEPRKTPIDDDRPRDVRVRRKRADDD